jgi:transposase
MGMMDPMKSAMIDISLTISAEQEAQLRREMKSNNSVNVYRRAAALLAIHKGNTVIQVADLLGVTRQTIYNWIATYGNADKPLDLEDAERPGRPSIWTTELQGALEQALAQSPEHYNYPASDWNLSLLQQHLAGICGKWLSEDALRRKLRLMGYDVQKRNQSAIRRLRPQASAPSKASKLKLEPMPPPPGVETQDQRLSA